MNHNYPKSWSWIQFFLPIAILFDMIDQMLEDLLPEKYLPPKLLDQILGKETAQELLSVEFKRYYKNAMRSGKPLPA